MLQSSSGSNPKLFPSSNPQESIILSFKPRSFYPGAIVVNRNKTLRGLIKENLKRINSVTFVDFSEIPDMTCQDVKVFFHWLRKLDNLCELTINLCQRDPAWNTRNIVNNLKRFFERTQLFSKLSSLKINLSHRFDIPSDLFKDFAMEFPRLSKLYLSLSSCIQPKEDFIKNLSKSISYLICLVEMSLSFTSTQLGNQELIVLLSSFKSLRFIRYLKLDFSRSQGFDTLAIKGLCKALRGLEHLQGLAINLSQCTQLNNLDVKSLVCSIKKLRNLSRLELSLLKIGTLHIEIPQMLMGHGGSFNQLTHLSLRLPLQYNCLGVSKDFARSFVPLANLSSLKLSLCDLRTGSQWVKEDIWEALVALPKLSRLCLDFYSDYSMDQLLTSLGRALKRLRLTGFGLNFHGSLRIRTSAWETLSDGIDALVSLSKLSLNLSNNYGFDPDLIRKFPFGLKNTKGLLDFTFGFEVPSALTKKLLENLSPILKNQRNLNTLQLNFRRDDKLKFDDIREIFSTLSEAQYLTKISLDLGPQLLPNHENQVGVIHSLRLLPSLKYLELEFLSCKEPQLLALSAQLTQLLQIFSIILRFSYGIGISPRTKICFSKNLRKLKNLKEFHLGIQSHQLHVQALNYRRISWRLKDIYAGYDKAELIHYERQEKRRRWLVNSCDCWDFCRNLLCIALVCAPGIALLLFIILGITVWKIG